MILVLEAKEMHNAAICASKARLFPRLTKRNATLHQVMLWKA